ncbi:hypothetical protein R3W88_027105 [Solanum pinnatisectum]|uniref:Uncharacterized protein n=1 Tax=Solanum pinnatisectum TaxID=50273 RepID=A0AAV9LF34_9SOLN|nr:hypothetical protein R3W88_027105 [Solanum pinnatisectum]
MDFFSTLALSKLPPMTKVDTNVSSIPLIIVTNNDLCNDDTPSDSLLSSGTYIDVLLDVRVENTTPNKGDVPNEGKVSEVTLNTWAPSCNGNIVPRDQNMNGILSS